tara:strand:- start:11 stop:610 length:600 start_codon:yes stop_codon:yes gene_type:complete
MANFKTQKIFGLIVSYLLHPMLISFCTFWYLIYYSPIINEEKNSVFFICLTFSTILPIVFFLILKNKNLITDLNASKKEERLLPMAFGALFFLIGFIILRTMNVPLLMQGIMFCGLMNTILAWLITKHWKISIHALSLSTSVTIFWIFGYKYFVVSIGLLFLVTIARIFSNAHNLLQIIVGILTGFISTFIYYNILFIQ